MSHERYALEPVASLWTDHSKMGVWTQIEKAVVQAYHYEGMVSSEDNNAVQVAFAPSIDRVKEIELETNHDVIAFVQALRENIERPYARKWVHHGMTSSDLVDTANAVLMSESGIAVLAAAKDLLATMDTMAKDHRDTVMVGRTHGIHAEPTTFGHKIAGYRDALERRYLSLSSALERIAVGKISGAVGTHSNVHPRVEHWVLESLGLRAEKHATQVVARDRYAEVVSALALLSAVVEQIAQEIRLLQRTEVREVAESFGRGQKGSSAMPHKRNPMTAERLCGLARVMRGYAQMALEDVALWHERDLTHSSVERIVIPGAFSIAHYQVVTLNRLLLHLEVDREQMRKNLDLTKGLVYSSRVLSHLVEKGMDSDKAYGAVQKASFRVWSGEGTLQQEFPDMPDDVFDPQHFLRHLDYGSRDT